MTHHAHLRSAQRRVWYALILVTGVMVAGTVGMRICENYSWMDAFYFTVMIATAQGSPVTPGTAAGKLFASFLAFISVGMMITTLGFLFGPLLGKLWHIGRMNLEEEALKNKSRK